ncbi:MAG TPA: hypothetical protein PKM67_02555 [Kiritimatiellia bacterium]|nr:hypothetical protein [Kiritimatiellia bacterium]HNS80322.1 hypothetical protein [Kiritimatiellia bacterium]HPA77212.1 hypothetical protein [Kiritimatiellia bacterium]HQQ04574.1 hypothetical protein [Kiritimatiellia bacterium]
MTDFQAHIPIPRQLWLRDRCIAVETQFQKSIGRGTFVTRFLPLLVILALAYWNRIQTPPRVAGWIAVPVTAAAFYFALLVLSHRFHDIGQSGANLLQIVLPVFVWLWVGGDLMAKLPPRLWIGTAAVLAVWPVIVILRLCLQRGTQTQAA